MATFRFDANQIKTILTKFESKSEIAIKMFCAEGAKKFENYAKINRPWTDRTGMARMRLTGYVEYLPNSYRICIAHGVNYGASLEYEHERRYAILQPTINAVSPEILEGFNRFMSRIK